MVVVEVVVVVVVVVVEVASHFWYMRKHDFNSDPASNNPVISDRIAPFGPKHHCLEVVASF